MEVTRRTQNIGEGKDPSGFRWRSSILGACTVSPQGALFRGPLPGPEALGSGRTCSGPSEGRRRRRRRRRSLPRPPGVAAEPQQIRLVLTSWLFTSETYPESGSIGPPSVIITLLQASHGHDHILSTGLPASSPALAFLHRRPPPHHLRNKGQSLKSVTLSSFASDVLVHIHSPTSISQENSYSFCKL
nr:uncharacterized protein LOC105496468 [Macaca nemestrina]